MDLLIGLVSLIGFLLSLAVHISALLGTDVSAHWPAVWLLHVGVFAVFFPFVFFSRRALGKKPTFAEIRSAFPAWVVMLGIAMFVYAALNFLLAFRALDGGSPAVRDGAYVLLNHGTLIRELTQAEYSLFKANEIRAFSGHWLVFYFLPFAYFMLRKKFKSTVHVNR